MGRILAIDYGRKNVGLAVTDPLQISSRILPYQVETNIKDWLLKYFETEDVEVIVMGYPEHKDGRLTDLTKDIDLLIGTIKKQNSKVKIVLSDESFTSQEAMKLMIQDGLSKKKRREKGLIDSYSALVILEDYLRIIK